MTDENTTDSEEELSGMSQAARQATMDKLVPGLEPAEYGRMPASFHANSQRVVPTMETGVLKDETSKCKADSDTTFPESPKKPIRRPILPRDTYDGVDSDDETDEEDTAEQDDESEEEKPQVVGEIEIDMGEEEEEFLEFSRHALGISDDQWGEIVRDRQSRGGKSPLVMLMIFFLNVILLAFVPASAMSANSSANVSPSKDKSTANVPQSRPLVPGPRPNVNSNLDSFEAVMQAMDAELARSHKQKSTTKSAKTDKGKGKAGAPSFEDEADIEAAMDAELKYTLERGGSGDDNDDGDEEEPMDYNLIKNFLESFKSQGGLSGPVSSMAGRLRPGWQLPRDEA